MANYYATARSNYFRVRNVEKFRDWVQSIPGLRILEKEVDGEVQYFGICARDTDSGGWPGHRFAQTPDENDTELDLLTELSKHLVPDSVAVLMEAGHEALRYVVGHAQAVDCHGNVVEVSLNDIYAEARQDLGGEITEAQY